MLNTLNQINDNITKIKEYFKKAPAMAGGVTYLTASWPMFKNFVPTTDIKYQETEGLISQTNALIQSLTENKDFSKDFFNLDKNTQFTLLTFSNHSYLSVTEKIKLSNFTFEVFSKLDAPDHYTKTSIDWSLQSLFNTSSLFNPDNIKELKSNFVESKTYFDYLNSSEEKEKLKTKFENLISKEFANFKSSNQNTLESLYPNMIAIIGMKMINSPQQNLNATDFSINNTISFKDMKKLHAIKNKYKLFDPACTLFSRDFGIFGFTQRAEEDAKEERAILRQKKMLEKTIQSTTALPRPESLKI